MVSNNLIIDLGGERDKQRIPLVTRKRTPIPNAIRGEKPPSFYNLARDMHQCHESARLRSATSRYNCLGLVFASRRTCIEPEHMDLILREDEYRKLTGPQEVEQGDLVLYKKRDCHEYSHVGIIIEINKNIEKAKRELLVLSQWGNHGEYIHEAHDVPEQLGKPHEYWTERKEVQ